MLNPNRTVVGELRLITRTFDEVRLITRTFDEVRLVARILDGELRLETKI